MSQHNVKAGTMIRAIILPILMYFFFISKVSAQPNTKPFHVIAFYTAKEDLAHISFVHEANKWFSAMAIKYHFTYDSTKNCDNLNAEFLSHYQVVLFLDTRPESLSQRDAFKQYMEAYLSDTTS